MKFDLGIGIVLEDCQMGVNLRILNEGCVILQKIKKTPNHRYTSEQTRRSSMTNSVTENHWDR